ncbi:MAG TPA: DUF6790 family protein [Candidatus Acidoferrum sp.]|jgi:hypothetical protein|nr:DUF6790 family protein [Candidatus Acidoferrum sp.]
MIVRGFLATFPLWMLLLALAVAWVRIARGARVPARVLATEVLFWGVGITGLWGFVVHVFFPRDASGTIGWNANGFETEVGMANLALAVLGMTSRSAIRPYRLAAALGAACFLWGSAASHIVDFVAHGNVAPANAGAIISADILTPLIALAAVLASPPPRIIT